MVQCSTCADFVPRAEAALFVDDLNHAHHLREGIGFLPVTSSPRGTASPESLHSQIAPLTICGCTASCEAGFEVDLPIIKNWHA